MSARLNNFNVLPYSNSLQLFFNSSILSADLLNRFLIKPRLFGFLNTSGLFSLTVEFRFKLPFNNGFSKFRNRVHFLIYYLFFEVLVGQRPLVEVKKNVSSQGFLAKNKRDVKKFQLTSHTDFFVLRTEVFQFYQISIFLNYIIFFLVAYTDSNTVTPSKLIKVNLETSETAVTGFIKNLSLLSFFNLIDDLSGSFFEFKFKLLPFNPKIKFLENHKLNILSFFSNGYGIFFKNFTEKKIFNLRKINFFN